MSSGAEPLRNRGELLWRWVGSCIEMNVEPKAERLCAVVSSKQRRLEVFALLEDISMDAAMRRHLSSSDVQRRILEATLPVVVAYRQCVNRMPAVPERSRGLTELPGLFAAFDDLHLARHQSIIILSCILTKLFVEGAAGGSGRHFLQDSTSICEKVV